MHRRGDHAIVRLEPRESHIPERASVAAPVGAEPYKQSATPQKPPRPIRLFQPPEPVDALWVLPDDPPFHFTWRHRTHRIAQAGGPGRIAEEWWRSDGQLVEGAGSPDAIRDYYRVEDASGRRFWLFRAGLPGGRLLFLHGVFA